YTKCALKSYDSHRDSAWHRNLTPCATSMKAIFCSFFSKQKTAYDIGLGIPAEPLFRSDKLEPIPSALPSFQKLFQVSATALSIPGKISTTPEAASVTTLEISFAVDRKSGSAGMPRPISYAVFCLKKKNKK